jgi:hypothetical protein
VILIVTDSAVATACPRAGATLPLMPDTEGRGVGRHRGTGSAHRARGIGHPLRIQENAGYLLLVCLCRRPYVARILPEVLARVLAVLGPGFRVEAKDLLAQLGG